MNGAECTYCGACTHDEWNCPKKKEEEQKEIERCILYLIQRAYFVCKEEYLPNQFLQSEKKWWRFFTYKWWDELLTF